ncbi:MAG: hypothetical protein EKK64_06340 [Neisseriaceae bacterium]|jgi:hypothetical protein|nr:MAG: hypothetical protein EKK64_06340 [Neisseriaceae bacterium]
MNKKYFTLITTLSLIASTVYAKESINYNCQLVTGKIVKIPRNPVFKFTKAKKYSKDNYPMTHTQFFIHADDGNDYKVVVDNLFYKYISPEQITSNEDVNVINDFNNRFKVGDNVSACGKTFDKNDKLGIHFVHPSNCSTTQFNGFLKINGQDITNNNSYCTSCSCK